MNQISAGLAKVGRLIVAHGLVRPTSTVTANYTVAIEDDTIFVNAASKTITLPSAIVAGNGARYTIANKNTTGTTLAAVAGTLNGSATDTTSLATAFTHVTYASDGANWFTI